MFNIRRRLLALACTAGIFGGGVALSPAINVLAAPEEKEGGNDTFETADELTPNKEVIGALSTKEDVDYYKVTFAENGRMNLSFSGADHDDRDSYWKLRIYDENKIPLDKYYYEVCGNTKEAVQTFSDKGVSAGTYYIEVIRGYDWANDDYKLKVNFEATDSWEAEWNDSIETAQKIDVNKSINGNITVEYDTDWYQFTLTEPGAIRYSFKHDRVDDNDSYWGACLYDDDGANLLNDKYFAGNVSSTETSEHVGVPAGTYYLKVWRGYDWDSTKKYTFNIEYEASSDWETEDNNSVESADVIEIGKTIYASRTLKSDVDYFKISIPAAGVATLNFGHNRIDSSETHWTVKVLDSNATEIKDAQYGVKGNTTGIQPLGEVELSEGTYYISVGKGYYDSFIDYSLLINFKETKQNGLYQGADGHWYWYEDGKVATDKNGFVDWESSKFFLVKGMVDENANGLVQDIKNTADWYYCANGQAQTQYTGLAEYDGKWFYVEKGKLNTTLAAYVEYDGGLFFVGAGRIMKEVSGLAKDPNGSDWYYLADGQAQTQYTGLAQYDGAWFYVIAGKFAQDYSGSVKYDGATFQVEKGEVVQ